MKDVSCIECGETVRLNADLMLGEIVQCPDCGVELEVIGLNPVQIDLAPEVEEDWGE